MPILEVFQHLPHRGHDSPIRLAREAVTIERLRRTSAASEQRRVLFPLPPLPWPLKRVQTGSVQRQMGTADCPTRSGQGEEPKSRLHLVPQDSSLAGDKENGGEREGMEVT